MSYPVSVKGVLQLPSGDVLLLRNERAEWELPGGRIEAGETPEQCLARECMEELQAPVVVEDLLDAGLAEVIPGKYVFIVSYRCRLVEAVSFRISEEHTDFASFPADQLPAALPAFYRRAIQRATDNGMTPIHR